MDSDYKLFDPKEEEKEEEKKKKKKDHSSGYYKFINQFKFHLKKIENDFTGQEINQLPNHFNLINKYENEFEEQRENCLNCYNALKEQISLIEKVVPNFDINIFNTFFQNFEEYYQFFKKSQEILRTFSQFNDDTQNLFYILKQKNFCVEALKDFVDKISEEYAEKIEQYENLNEKYKTLLESYDKLYKIYQESKSDLKQYENIDNKELMIKKLNEKIQDLNIENDRIKKKYGECSNDLELLNLAVKVKYVPKTESEKIINELKFRMNKIESDNINFKQEIKNLKIENEKLTQENEYLEEQINNQLNNIKLYKSNNDSSNHNLENLIEENEEKENEEKEKENSEDLENDFYSGNDLDELIKDCEENESEEKQPIENGKSKENIDKPKPNEQNLLSKDPSAHIIEVKNNNDSNTNENNVNIMNNNINNNNNINKPINKNSDEKFQKSVSFDIGNNLKNSLARGKSKSIKLRGAPKKFRHSGSVKIRLNQKPSNNINSAYNIMFQGKQFQFPSRVATKKNFDYFKQFFFLLFQSMKMNSDKIAPFLGYDPETLYAQCRNEHIPFHKYQNWLEKQILRREQIENEKKYEDFATITGIFCSSLI